MPQENMGDEVSGVTVVGGGDAGLLAALAIRRVNPGLDIRVVDDFAESPTRVGKSTFQAVVPLLHDVLGIDEGRVHSADRERGEQSRIAAADDRDPRDFVPHVLLGHRWFRLNSCLCLVGRYR